MAGVTEAKENHLALIEQDSQLLLDALLTLASMQSRLSTITSPFTSTLRDYLFTGSPAFKSCWA
jgi:hypothetical protein